MKSSRAIVITLNKLQVVFECLPVVVSKGSGLLGSSLIPCYNACYLRVWLLSEQRFLHYKQVDSVVHMFYVSGFLWIERRINTHHLRKLFSPIVSIILQTRQYNIIKCTNVHISDHMLYLTCMSENVFCRLHIP